MPATPAGFAHPDVLVSTDWVREHLNDPKVRLVEVNVDTQAYDAGHLPGAVGWNWQTQTQDTVRRDIVGREAFERLMSEAGVGVRASDGKLMWRYEKAANGTANCTTPVYHQGKVFYTSAYGTGCGLLALTPANGEIKAHGDRSLSEEDLTAISTWLDDRRTLLAQRDIDDILRTVDHLNLTAQWVQTKATEADLDQVADALLMAMHDLRSVIVRRLAGG